jgi:hypothetical protein
LTPDDFRRLALDMPGAVEAAHMGHPDFRANGRIFATLHTGDTFGMVKLTPEEQHELMKTEPEMFAPSPGAWGRQGCTNVRLSVARIDAVRGAMLLAWEHVQEKSARKRPPRAAPRPGRKPRRAR